MPSCPHLTGLNLSTLALPFLFTTCVDAMQFWPFRRGTGVISPRNGVTHLTPINMAENNRKCMGFHCGYFTLLIGVKLHPN